MCRIVMVLTTCFCMIYSALAESALPAGYKAIVFGEKDDVEWRHDDKNMYLRVEADFNGDGVIDEARLLRSEDGTRGALFCFLKDQAGKITTFKLEESDDQVTKNRMGIQKANPGTHLTAAGLGYGSDALNKDLPKTIELKNPAIELLYHECSSLFYYWDDASKSFKNVWISD